MSAADSTTRLATLDVWCVGADATSLPSPAAFARYGWQTSVLEAHEAAARLASGVVPDLFVVAMATTEVQFGWFESARQVLAAREVPVVALSGGGEAPRWMALRVGIGHVVELPWTAERLIDQARHARQAGRSGVLTGSLGQLSAADLLQTAEVSRRSGAIVLRRGRRLARIVLQDGAVVDAALDDGTRGRDVLFEVALWEDGFFEADFRPVEIRERTVDESLGSLLLEAARRADERARDVSERPHASLPDPPPLPPPHHLVGHRALTLVSIASGWACDHLASTLVGRRFAETHESLCADHPLLRRFEVLSDGRVRWVGAVLEPEEAAPMLAGVAAWLVAVLARLERAVPGKFDLATLAALTEAIGDDMTALGFDAALGIDRKEARNA